LPQWKQYQKIVTIIFSKQEKNQGVKVYALIVFPCFEKTIVTIFFIWGSNQKKNFSQLKKFA